jgi:beta-galactosidase/beta-glucuronidase
MSVQLRLLRLTPVEAVIECDAPAGAEVRGRLAGPTCVYATTVEVAHHVCGNRIIIPEPAWWDPQSPFLYRGLLTVCRDGVELEHEQVQIGLRHTIRADRGLVHNGRRIELTSQRILAADEADLLRLRNDGFNAVDVPTATAEQACEIADRIGLFVVADAAAIDPLRHPSAITS